jgi:hypothetical protein
MKVQQSSLKGAVMAQRVEVLLVDDIDGGEADETVRFALDGVQYEIDLSEDKAGQLRSALQPFMEKGRRERGKRRAPARAASSRERSAEIRAWARENGIEVNDRGRIPAQVVEKYEAEVG